MIREVRFADEFLDQTIKDVGQGHFTTITVESPEA